LVYDLVNNYRNVFLHRPRRFGKSLLTSTLECYFQGKKELFEGLAMEKLETEWKEYPVLHFDMSDLSSDSIADLKETLAGQLEDYEQIYGIGNPAKALGLRLKKLIKAANKSTGMPPVVLIDEYDKPVLGTISDKERMDEVRKIMQNFYAPLKASNLRFLFLTGITKFSQMSIFSELNNLEIISMLPRYAALCGITEEEMLRDLDFGIQEMADANGWTKEECIAKLKNNYDGYHFSHTSPDIYNPFSLLQAIESGEIEKYWYAVTPSYIIEYMKKFDIKPQTLGRQKSYASAFDVSIQDAVSITPILYQSGYLTIKGYDPNREEYTLDIPNNEIREGLMQNMVTYIGAGSLTAALSLVNDMREAFNDDDFDKVMKLLQTYLATVPYTSIKDCEGHYQSLFYVLFSLMSKNVQVEVRTPQGRVDLVVESPKHIYLIEIKLNKSADMAIDQIDLKHYADKFSLDTKPVKKVGVNFSSETGNITDWKVL